MPVASRTEDGKLVGRQDFRLHLNYILSLNLRPRRGFCSVKRARQRTARVAVDMTNFLSVAKIRLSGECGWLGSSLPWYVLRDLHLGAKVRSAW